MEEDEERQRLSGDLVIHAARLVRSVRLLTDAPGQAVRVISLLDEYGALSVSALARIDRCSQPTMSGAVASLVRRGWVSKSPDPADARVSQVALTELGAAELAEVRRVHADAVARLVSAHPTHDVDDLRAAVALLRDLVEPS